MTEKEARKLAELVRIVCPVCWVEPLEPKFKIVAQIEGSLPFSIVSFESFQLFLIYAKSRGKI